MITAGIWPDGKRLVVVILDDAERPKKPMLVGRTADAAEPLVDYLAESRAEIVLADTLLVEPIGSAAARSGPIWIAPRFLVDTVRQAAALSPRAVATMLARLPRLPAMRRELRRNSADPRQLTLLP